MRWIKKRTWAWFLGIYLTSGFLLTIGTGDESDMWIRHKPDTFGVKDGKVEVGFKGTRMQYDSTVEPGGQHQEPPYAASSSYGGGGHDHNSPVSAPIVDTWGQ